MRQSFEEVWVPVKSYEGLYEISNLGKVRNSKGKYLKLYTDACGYFRIRLSKSKKSKEFKISRLVFCSFVGDIPSKHEINHIDGNKKNNIPKNLECVTHAENMAHATSIGLIPRGSKHHNSKLTERDVIKIRNLYFNRNKEASAIAPIFDVSKRTIFKIVRRKLWKHI